ncbi:MAG: hypothetical protein AB1798_20825, partial [Spirochaetota bacterium]
MFEAYRQVLGKDWLKVYLLLKALRCPDLIGQLAVLLSMDLHDPTTEYGGFLSLTEDSDCPVQFFQMPSAAEN